MFKNARKVDLQLAATELGESITDKMTVTDLINIIRDTEKFKTEPDFVTGLIEGIIEDRKAELEEIEKNKQLELQLEQIKLERAKAELELSRTKTVSKTDINDSENKTETGDSLDSLIKSVKTLTIRIPSRPEGWGLFFASLERSFITKNVPDKFKAEILLNLLGEKASNVISYISDNELSDYDKVKKIVLREFEPTPQSCLEQFRKTTRQTNETHVQFASRLTTSFDYYLKLREVSDFEKLKQLIVSDKLFQTLDKETASHISVRQSDSWFDPVTLGKESDLFFVSRGRSLTDVNNQKSCNTRNVSRIFLADSKSKNLKCGMCLENHPLYKCRNYLALPVSERVEVIKKNNFCFNCLGKHLVNNCKSHFSCSLCKRNGKTRRHHFSLHFPRDSESLRNESATNSSNLDLSTTGGRESNLSPIAPAFQPAVNTARNQNNNSVLSTRVINQSKSVLLSTVNCLLRDESGNNYRARAILDQGAMNNYMTTDCANSLNLKRKRTNLTVCGIGDTFTTIKSVVNATISNLEGNFEKELDFLIVSKITDFMPSKVFEINIPELKYIKLADENFNMPGRVDLLLSAEIFYELLRPGQICPANSNLIFQNTVFGYVASGCVPVKTQGRVYCGFIDNSSLNETLEKFWEIENVQIEVPQNKEAIICEEHFQKNVKRDSTGRYMVKMPLKDDPMCLGKSKDIALKKLNSLWNRFLKEPEYLALYREFLREYEKLGHMAEISECGEEVGTYYIPHLGVYRPDKSTTKLRVVFNASSQTTLGNSLNSLQYNGGVIQEDLFNIMTRFRKHIYVFVADIKQMYRMILIDPSQTKLQRILWREGVNEPVKTYELKTVTYGTVSAPYLATRVLLQLSRDEHQNYPLASPVLEKNFYIDDVLSGADSLSVAKELQSELTKVLNSAGMTLHKWFSNNVELKTGPDGNYNFQEETKTLGVTWKPAMDNFVFQIQPEIVVPPTKRSVLSTIARIFDPLGLLGPVITKAKAFLQQLWCLKLDWSDPLPETEAHQWENFMQSLYTINSISVKRCILIEKSVQIELHGFADASESAYGCVIYCKSTSASGDFEVNLVCSKSRVSPLKRVTIPRLELSAAVLLSKLITKVKSALQLKTVDIYLWSDSMIVLSWIQKEPYLLKTFVANRIATIQDLTNVQQWRHVSSENNPADLISRGMDPEKLIKRKLWFEGPTFLTERDYPNREIPTSVIRDEFICELKHSEQSDFSVLTVTLSSFIEELFDISNDYTKILHILSYLFRFVHNLKNPEEKRRGPLKTEEINQAEIYLVKQIQRVEFTEELKCLTQQKSIPGKSKIKCLNPFLDKDGLLRVNGRLKNANINFNSKFQIILPKSNKLTKLILESYHKRYFHLGPTALLHYVRQKFWPVQGKATCRKVVHDCVKCFRVNPVGVEQLMGDLPKERVTPDFPFNCSGVDFCGPFLVKYKHQRKGIYHKVYVCIFICMVTKAIHLELVTDLTSEAFIACLKRFVARRGLCSKLFSDNATNFIGANKELKRLHSLVVKPDDNLASYMSTEGIKWNFLPPRAPNFGGLWESGVKAFKFHFKRVIGNSKLVYEEFLTITTQIESILNSRPLVPLSSDTEVYEVLTPAHFLIGRPLNAIVEPNLIEVKDNRLSNWKKLSKTIQIFWKKWHIQYLNNLQQRSKWMIEKENVKIGELVILKDENLPPQKWALGRVTKLYFGEDKRVRVVKVKTQSGVFKRPISKICILPINV